MKSKYRRKAEKRVKEKVEFHKHLRSFIVVNLIMLVMILFYGGSWIWMMGMFFWGIGLFSSYIKIYGLGKQGYLSQDWEEEMIQDEMKKMGVEEEEGNDHLDLDRIKEKKPLYDERDLV
jgi:hypothetical protein